MLGVLVLLACLVLGWQTYHRPAIGLGAIGVAFALQCLYGNDQPGLLVAGINTYAGDLAALIVFQAALLRLVARPWRSWGLPTLVALALGLVYGQSFLRGILSFGLKAAGLNFRLSFITYAYLLFGLVYFDLKSFQLELKRGMEFLFIFIIGVVLVRWFTVATGLYVNTTWGTSTGSDVKIPIRVILSFETILIAQISIIWMVWRDHSRAAWLGILVVFFLQWRSVWLALIFGGIYLFYWNFRQKSEWKINFGMIAIAGVALLLVIIAFTISPALKATFEGSATNESTWVWRVAGWVAALAPDQMPGWAWLIGKPFGSPSTRWVEGRVTDLSYHSHYVAILVQTGILGLALWLFLWVMAARRIEGRPWAAIIVLTQALYGVAYPVEVTQGFILAMALALPRSEGSLLPSKKNSLDILKE